MVAHELEIKERTEDVAIKDDVTFSTMLLPDFILQGLNKAGFKKPSPIQLAAIPLARCGLDLIVQAKSGTGKTLVFSITALESINLSIKRVQVIILAPTREIAFQIADVIMSIGSSMKGLKVGTFVGGIPTNFDRAEMKGCHIVVGSPGRIRHLIELNVLDAKAVRLFILDEADKLLEKDFDFKHDLNFIFNNCGESKQVLALSATYSSELLEFTGKYMRDGKHVTPSGGPTPILLGLRQMVLISRDHPDFVARLSIKEKELINILETVSFDQCCIFLNYATRAESINSILKKKGFSSICLTGKQDMATRMEAISTFKSGGCRILVTTDLAARGIDASSINLVINCELPWDAATYLHRMGRAGRYGSHGICISIISHGIELNKFKNLLGMIGGKSMFVNVIPKLHRVDLWTEDLCNFDKIQGTIESDMPEENQQILDKDLLTANNDLKNNTKESFYLIEQDQESENSTSTLVKKDIAESISLKDLQEELNSFLKEPIKPQQTPRKSVPKKVPTYSEIVTNSRKKILPVNKSYLGLANCKVINNVCAVPEYRENIIEKTNDRVSDISEKVEHKEKSVSARESSTCNKKVEDIKEAMAVVNDMSSDNVPENVKDDKNKFDIRILNKSSVKAVNANKNIIADEVPDIGLLLTPVSLNSKVSEVDGTECSKRKRSESSDDFDSYTYIIDSNDDYETVDDNSSLSGIDLNSNPDNFESLSVITPCYEEESEVDYPSEIFQFVDSDDEEIDKSAPTDWFSIISKEIQNYVIYSRQYMNVMQLSNSNTK